MMTFKEWWELAENHKDEISNIILDYHPVNANWHGWLPVTAPNAQAACDAIAAEIKAKGPKRDIKAELEKAYESKDAELLMELCDQAWFGVPESTSCWNIAGFDQLCDLMEGWDN